MKNTRRCPNEALLRVCRKQNDVHSVEDTIRTRNIICCGKSKRIPVEPIGFVGYNMPRFYRLSDFNRW